MSERIIIGAPLIGTPILIGSEHSAYPARRFGMEIERIGYEAMRTAFPDRQEEDIRFLFDPDDAERINERIRTIEHLGKSGVCWAVPEVLKSRKEVTGLEESGEAKISVLDERQDVIRLLGFGLLRSNKSNSRTVNMIAEKIFRLPAVAETAMLHVRPDAREKGIGSMLLRRLGITAYDRKLMTKPAFTVIDGYTSAKKFFEFYGLQQSETIPPKIIADFFGPGKAATAHTYEAPNWNRVLVNIHEREKLPSIETAKRQQPAVADA